MGSVANFPDQTIYWNIEETKPQHSVDNSLLLSSLRQNLEASYESRRLSPLRQSEFDSKHGRRCEQDVVGFEYPRDRPARLR